MITLLKKLHILHTWTKWSVKSTNTVSYTWTSPNRYAYIEQTQQRVCDVCGLTRTKKEAI